MLLGLHTYSFHLHGMGQNWGGGKISMDIHRPKPVCNSAFHPEVVPQLERVADLVGAHADSAKNAGVRLCLENHTEAFNLEVEFDPGSSDMETARKLEYEAVVESIRFVREDLGV